MPIMDFGSFEVEIPEGLTDAQISEVAEAATAATRQNSNKLPQDYSPPMGSSVLSRVGKLAGDIADIGAAARSKISSLPSTPLTIPVKAVAALTIPETKEEVYGQGLALVASPLAEFAAGKLVGAIAPKVLESAAQNAAQAAQPIEKSALQIVTDALKGTAKYSREEQEALYSEERARRAGKIADIFATQGGEAAQKAALGAAKGELPKFEFKGIGDQIPVAAVNDLKTQIVKHPDLMPFEKLAALNEFDKLIGRRSGQIPTESGIALLSKVFPNDFINTVLEKRPLLEKAWSIGGDVLNIPRAAMATADLSMPLRQGIFLAGSQPQRFIAASGSMLRYFASEKAYEGLGKEIAAMPTYPLMKEAKLALTDVGQGLSGREEAFKSNLVEKIPIFGSLARASNRAASGFLNKLRADVFNDIVSKPGAPRTPKFLNDAASFVNSATGRGNVSLPQGAQQILNGLFFSPRLMQSRLSLLNPVYYMQLHPLVRREAIKAALSFAGGAASVLGLAKAAGLDVGTDPRNADFLKIRTGDTRYDIMGGFQQYLVLGARLATGKMIDSTTGKEFDLSEGFNSEGRLGALKRFFEFKTAPVANFVIGALRGKNALGEKFEPGPEVLSRFIPMLAQDIYDLYREKGPSGIPLAVPAVFGAGVQTYGPKIPLVERGKYGNAAVTFRQQPGLAEAMINAATGKQITNIPPAQIPAIMKERQIEQQNEIGLSNAKTRVLQTGKPEIFQNKIIYLDRGEVKSKVRGRTGSNINRLQAIQEFLNAPR